MASIKTGARGTPSGTTDARQELARVECDVAAVVEELSKIDLSPQTHRHALNLLSRFFSWPCRGADGRDMLAHEAVPGGAAVKRKAGLIGRAGVRGQELERSGAVHRGFRNLK